MIRIGIDLGGTKIELIALNGFGQELTRIRIDTPRNGYEAIIRAIAELVDSAENSLGLSATVGIGTPGALSKFTGHLKNSNTVVLNGKPLLEDLQTALKRKIRIANDADCFALSEAVDGSAAKAGIAFGVILGTGVGGGIVVNGRLLSGQNAIAGEWGHNQMPWPAEKDWPLPACYCGKKGCIETYISGPGLASAHKLQYGVELTAAEIVDASIQGDSACDESLQQYEGRLARSLALVINILDPDIIVLGGGLSNCARLYENVPQLWQEFVFSDGVSTRLVPPLYGDSSGVRGAAWLWDGLE